MDTSSIGLGLAFVAGLLSFLSPCVLPLAPAYLAYLAGASVDDLAEANAHRRAKTLLHAVAFVLGFSMVFIAIWVSLGLIGNIVPYYLNELRVVGGIILIVVGLHVIGLFQIPLLLMERRFHFDIRRHGHHLWTSFAIGAVFAAGWTPCIGPTLGGIIALASQTSTVLTGAYLLIAYSLGLAVPFLLCALLIDRVAPALRHARRYMRVVTVAQGVFLIGVGLLMLFDMFLYLPQYFNWEFIVI